MFCISILVTNSGSSVLAGLIHNVGSKWVNKNSTVRLVLNVEPAPHRFTHMSTECFICNKNSNMLSLGCHGCAVGSIVASQFWAPWHDPGLVWILCDVLDMCKWVSSGLSSSLRIQHVATATDNRKRKTNLTTIVNLLVLFVFTYITSIHLWTILNTLSM